MSFKKAALTLALLTTTSAFAKDYIRLENTVNVDIFKLETQVKMGEGFNGIMSLDSNRETDGLEYNLALAYTKYTKAYSKQFVAEFDLGIAYETTGATYATLARQMNIADDFKDSAGAVWAGLTLNYIVLPNVITSVDLSATHDVYNETILGMYRARARFIYQPIDRVNLIYRAGLSYAHSDVTKQIIKAGNVVADDYLVSHEFLIAYSGTSGLEPYVMFKDMENDASYDVVIGFYYRFK